MFVRILVATVVLSTLIFSEQRTDAHPVGSSYQVLPEIPGYVPVYIRKGDTPLEEINPALAEAFRSLEEWDSSEDSPESKSHYILTGDALLTSDKLDYVSSENDDENDVANHLLKSNDDEKVGGDNSH